MRVRTGCVAGVPDMVQVLPMGRTRTQHGDFVLDGDSAAQVVREFQGRKNEMVLDYEHQTLGGGEAPAAGWMEALEVRQDGLWARVRWTQRARQYIEAGEYRYISPVFVTQRRDGEFVVQRLLNAALTNQPAIDAMHPVTCASLENAAADAMRAVETTTKKKEERMKGVLEALGLSEEATGQEAASAVQGLKQEIAALRSGFARLREMLGLGDGAEGDAGSADDGELRGAVLAMKASHESVGELVQRTQTLEGELRRREATDLVSMAMKEGKLSPAQGCWAREYAGRDPEGFRAFVAKAAVVVPQGEQAAREAAPQGVGVTDVLQGAVNRSLGITDEGWKRFGPASRGVRG